ncbi:MAG TPA: exopolysaccharide biosynthesis polyprenyl glycosylphosphotransferase [Elusimicrobiota bacterium]|nr:exopolysaccharide biosynthesis polyprenyl glycosylphosphotransferase [Elusimicrobiota bacterium]
MSSDTPAHTFSRDAVREAERPPIARKSFGDRIAPENWVAFFFAGDFIALLLSSALVSKLLLLVDGEDVAVGRSKLIGICASIFMYFALAQILAVYDRKFIFNLGHAAKKTVLTLVFVFGFIFTMAFVAKYSNDAGRRWFFVWFLLNAFFLVGYRFLALLYVQKRLEAGAYVQKAVSIALYCEPLSSEVIAASTHHAVKVAHTIRLNAVPDLPGAINQVMRDEIDSVYIAAPWVDAPLVLEQLTHLRRFAAQIYVIAEERRIGVNQLGIGAFGNNVAITAVDRPLDGWGLWLKRVQDVVVASVILTAVAPLMVAIALAVKLESPGPVFFKQRRTGFNGNLFELWKFRSMYADKSDLHASVQTSKLDARVTRIGRIIRRTSLDELPQLLNVLHGDMSIVGPRPHALQTRAEGRSLEELADQYAARHRVKPGLTGWAQVNGYRGELDSVEKVRRRVAHDIEYIDNWSTWFDIKIIFKTALLVIYDPAAF